MCRPPLRAFSSACRALMRGGAHAAVQSAGAWRGLVQLLLECSRGGGLDFQEACWALVASGAQGLAAHTSASDEVRCLQAFRSC